MTMDVRSYVGGYTASYVDLASKISERLPIVVATVLALSFLLLLLAFRSLLVPLQAAIMNLLSVAASFGVLTAVFQWGWGLSLVGLGRAVGHSPDRELRAVDDVCDSLWLVHGLRGVPGEPHHRVSREKGLALDPRWPAGLAAAHVSSAPLLSS